MPVHDWTRVEAGVFHDFHHAWIEEIKRALNSGLLPPDYYAMAEQHAAGLGPDVLTLEAVGDNEPEGGYPTIDAREGTALLLAEPTVCLVGETDMEFYRRKQKVVAVRHVTGDRLIAVIEIVSPGNKSSQHAIRSFLEKAGELLDRDIHLLIIDLHPPTPRDPQGIHAAIWQYLTDQEYRLPADKPLTLAAYEANLAVRAFVEHVAVGGELTDMPLFLRPRAHVPVPLEATYQTAWHAVPRRWRAVLERPVA